MDEASVEQATLEWLAESGWSVCNQNQLGRGDYQQVVLEDRLSRALRKLNPEPDFSDDLLDDAYHQLIMPKEGTLEMCNRAFHRFLVTGVLVQYKAHRSEIRGQFVRAVDFDNPASNDWLAVGQVKVSEGRASRRLDVVLFVNGMPLGVIELKNIADKDALRHAWQQLDTYKKELPSFFAFNELLMVSDGQNARVGTLTAGYEWFKPWRTITGDKLAHKSLSQLEVTIRGLFDQQRFLRMLRDFIVYEDTGGGKLLKKMAGYHQFHAVQTAVKETIRATKMQLADSYAPDTGRYKSGVGSGGSSGDRRIGVVWHKQEAGKRHPNNFATE